MGTIWRDGRPLRPRISLGWVVRDGALTALPGAPDLVSEKKFSNFVVDAEYRIEPHTNSGIGLRGRYEVQIADDADRPPSNRGSGAILGRIAPTVERREDRPGNGRCWRFAWWAARSP